MNDPHNKSTKLTQQSLVGAVIISEAFKHKVTAEYLLETLEKNLTRDVDKRDSQPLINDLRKFIEKDQT